MDLNPDSHFAYLSLAWIQLAKGCFDEAIAAGQHAVPLAPLDYFSSFVVGVTYYNAQKFDMAIESYRPTSELDWQVHGAVLEEFIRWVDKPAPPMWRGELLDGDGTVPHLCWSFYHVPKEELISAASVVSPELVPLLSLVKDEQPGAVLHSPSTSH